MRLIHLLRKPVSEGTVASNVLKHGVGAINIEASRISTQDSLDGGAYAKNPTPRADSYDMWTSERKGDSQAMRRGFADYEQPAGRWPANLILQHLDGCRREGTKKVRSPMRRPTGKPIYATEGSAVEWNANNVRDTTVRGHAGEDGNETVANWVCKAGCPVRVLDEDAGIRPSWGITHQPTRSGYDYRSAEDGGTHAYREPDTGGASRYFKQIGGEE